MFQKKTLALLLGIVAVPAFLLACGVDDDSPASVRDVPTTAAPRESDGATGSISVNLKNWAVEPSTETVRAGKVTFTVTHKEEGHAGHGGDEAGLIHQLVVAPLEEGAEVGQSRFGRPLLNLTDIKPDEVKTAEVELEPGKYELSCLLMEEIEGKSYNHYEEGMYALLVVE